MLEWLLALLRRWLSPAPSVPPAATIPAGLIVTLNLYVMPIVGAGTRQDLRRPKYKDSVFLTLSWGMFDYGNEPWCLVGIIDIPAGTDTTLRAQTQVIALPVNLDQVVGAGPLTQVRNDLESVNIPGTWVQATNTWREVVRFVGAVCQFAQRYQGLVVGGLWFTGGVTLATTYGTLPVAARNGLLSAAQSFGFDTNAVTGANTLRQILVSVGNQYLATQPPLQLAGVAL